MAPGQENPRPGAHSAAAFLASRWAFAKARVNTFPPLAKKWRRGELNPCPRRFPRRHLHVYSVLRFKEPNDAPTHCRLPSVREIDLTNQTRSLRQFASLLSTLPVVAGVRPGTSRSI